MRADDILTQIDTCLGDYAIGPDAMRCAPDGAADGKAVVFINVDTDAVQDRLRAVQESLRRMAEAFAPAAENAAKGVADFQRALHARPRPAGHGRPAWQTPYGPTRRRR